MLKNCKSPIIGGPERAILPYLPLPTCENEIVKSVEKFYEAHGFPQCIGAIDGAHIRIKKPISNPTDYINRKGTYSSNVQATVDYKFCFFYLVVKWPGSVHGARAFPNTPLKKKLSDVRIRKCSKTTVPGEPAVPIYLLGDPAYLCYHLLRKSFLTVGKIMKSNFLAIDYFRKDGY